MGKLKQGEDINGTGYEWEYAKKIDNRTTGQKVLNFIYNPETHAFLGRTAKSWGGILLFYAIFYSILALLFAICMKVLLSTLSDQFPKFQLNDSIIGSNPGLGFRPISKEPETTSVIWYNASDAANVDKWVKLIENWMHEDIDVNNNATNGVSCDYSTKLHEGQFCKVDWESPSNPCSKQNAFGYYNGTPCVFIKLNRIYNYVPEYYEKENDLPSDDKYFTSTLRDYIKNLNKTKPEEIKKIWVSCTAQSAHDVENIGPIKYYPEPGFPSYFYPYLKQNHYTSPIVAVHFMAPRRGVLINVECRAWAKYIHHKSSSQNREGSVHFELQVDGEPLKNWTDIVKETLKGRNPAANT